MTRFQGEKVISWKQQQSHAFIFRGHQHPSIQPPEDTLSLFNSLHSYHLPVHLASEQLTVNAAGIARLAHGQISHGCWCMWTITKQTVWPPHPRRCCWLTGLITLRPTCRSFSTRSLCVLCKHCACIHRTGSSWHFRRAEETGTRFGTHQSWTVDMSGSIETQQYVIFFP